MPLILVAHVDDEESLAEAVASPLRVAGYEVLQGTLIVGDSLVQEASKALEAGSPVVLCATVRALGTGWAHRVVNAARAYPRVRIFGLVMEKLAYAQQLTLDSRVAGYWSDPNRAIDELIGALQAYYPPESRSPDSTVAPRIFLSYRHEDTSWQAGRLGDALESRYGQGMVFQDIDSIHPGDDFVEVITSAVGSCEVLLVLIGSQWLTITDDNEMPRLDNPNDFVRLEIEAGLTRGVLIVPILLQGARMPRADELPASLAKLARRQALELDARRFKSDTSQLFIVLDRIITPVEAL